MARANGRGSETSEGGTPPNSSAHGTHVQELQLDPIDRNILRCLREDGRMANSEIARRLDIGEATVRRRLQRLVDSHALRVVPVVDPDTVGLRLSVLIGLKVELSRIEAIAAAVAELPEVRYVSLATGPYDLLVEAVMGSREPLAEFLFGPLAEVGGIVSSETSTILKVVKFAYEWEIPRLPHERADVSPPQHGA
ncbi:MAG: Lrp/AsnC family transcriptional regulator, regulator for asnA, asnC and gidA [Solirubrobacteraceae bacterium]|nr:Lrp/AsnC family transcriptional regulator, regulator for asnA, asnC and gidA [Solirubrobacteraceae bacterium]